MMDASTLTSVTRAMASPPVNSQMQGTAEATVSRRRECGAGLLGCVRGVLDDGIVQRLSRTGFDDPAGGAAVISDGWVRASISEACP